MDDYDPFSSNTQLIQSPFSAHVSKVCFVWYFFSFFLSFRFRTTPDSSPNLAPKLMLNFYCVLANNFSQTLYCPWDHRFVSNSSKNT